MKSRIFILACILLGSFNALAITATPTATPSIDTGEATATVTPLATATSAVSATPTTVATATVDCKIIGACEGTVTPTATATASATATHSPVATSTTTALPTSQVTVLPTAVATATATRTATGTAVATSTPVTTECTDGKDNDKDGKVDAADPGCQNGGTTEDGTGPIVTLIPECNDGIDNDGDGLTDLPEDPDCDSNTDITESVTGIPTANVCYDVSAQNIETALNKEAVLLTKLAHKAVKRVAATAANAKLRAQLARSLKRAEKLKDAVYKTRLADPSVFTVCQQLCVSVDNFFKIKLLGGLQNELRGLIKRLIARTYFNSLGFTKKNDPAVLESKKIQLRGKAGLDQLNAFLTQCGQGLLS